MKVSREQLKTRLAWPLDMKLEYFCKRYSEFVIFCKGNVYLSFSAGMDSDTARDIIEKIYDGTFKHITPNWERLMQYPKPPLVFSNTGLEYPEIVEHSKKFETVVIKPKMGFTRVITEIGVAVISKEVAQKIREILTTKSDKLRNKRLYGDEKGNGKIPEKWKKFLDAPFKISDKCCHHLKKEPFKRYERETGRKPIIFTTTDEATLRKTSYLKTGCNTFTEGKEKSRPFSIFQKADCWEYAARWGLRFAEVYYDRDVEVEQLDGSKKWEYIPAVERTGCTFCLFGIHLDKGANRIQRMAVSHPKFHNIIIYKYGLGKVLQWMGVPFEAQRSCSKTSAADIL
jgi:3'-phosphoadenosine 5'-phosphosulfate sulfotransferase (PAPS reductase)/FAD synthetase